MVIGKGQSNHSGNDRPPPTEVTMHDSPYDSKEEEDVLLEREVAIEYKDFVDKMLSKRAEAN
jgi:hypothetical protein